MCAEKILLKYFKSSYITKKKFVNKTLKATLPCAYKEDVFRTPRMLISNTN